MPYKGRVLDVNANPIIGATASVMSKDSTILSMSVTDTLGYYVLEVAKFPAAIRIQSLGYQSKDTLVTHNPDCVVETVLNDDIYQLGSVTVTPEMMQHFDSHTSFRIPQIDLAKYTNFGQALNLIPFMMVTSSGNISYKGSSNVVILLNGVQTAWAEIQSLSKEDVNKVDVYENPPAQYALTGANSVINIITRKNLSGGNLSLNLKDSFYPVYGNNSFAAFYNYKQSRFSLIAKNSMAHYKKVQTDESLQYTFDEKIFSKQKEGYDSPQSRDNNSITMGYMTSSPNKFQFSANLSTAFYKNSREKSQNINYMEDYSVYGQQNIFNKYNKNDLNLYFYKIWNGGRSLLVDVTGTLYDTEFKSDYKEWNWEDETISSSSAYATNRQSLLSTMQYSIPARFGNWTIGIRNSYQFAKQNDNNGEISQKQNLMHGYAQLYGKKGMLSYQFILAAKYLNLKKQDITIWSKWYPIPSAKFWLRPKKNITFQLIYNYNADVPSVSLMSETEQWLDNFYVYKGNSNLQPYRSHQLSIATSISTQHINFALQGLYNYSPNAIVNHFKETSDYILQTYANLKSKKEAGGQIVIDYFPLKDKSLKIGTVGIYIHHHGTENNGLSWNGYRYQLMGYVAYTLPKWELEAYYQYPGQTLDGQLVTPRAEVLRLDLAYKPMPNMSIGLQWNQPFMKGFVEGERTTETCLIKYISTSNIRDYSNMLCLKFSYNFSFGKQKKYTEQRVKNNDTDPGLLIK